nr:hypothetical protein [Quisquiliibacterium transsilvanicum]
MALAGWTTLLLDPYGTGDSDGATGDASLALWRADLLRASRLARERAPGPFVLWGTRLGALLAAELAIALDQIASAIIFWQPAATGAQLVDPLLKLATLGAAARKAAGRAGEADAAAKATAAARGMDAVASTDTGPASADREAPGFFPGIGDAARAEQVDVAGYRLRRELLDDLRGLTMQPPVQGEHSAPCPVLVLGIQRVYTPGAPSPKPLAQIAERWLHEGFLTSLRVVPGEPFWSSLEPSTPLLAFDATETFLESIDGDA